MTIVTDLQYFPPSIFFNWLKQSSHCVFDQYEQFHKADFFTRCVVSGANGPVTLSIPVAGGRNQHGPINEVKVDRREPWQRRHFKTLESAYNKSPWFPFFRDELELLYRRPCVFLIDWNFACMQWVCDKLSIATELCWLGSEEEVPTSEGLFDRRKQLHPATLAALDPLPDPYPQVFDQRFGFVPNLSVIDRLFCEGNKFTDGRW